MDTFWDPQPYAVIDKFDPKKLKYEAWFKVLREPDEVPHAPLSIFADAPVRMLTGVAEKYRTTIDQVQPYRAGNGAERDKLVLLNSLSNIDKHRFVHPSWATFGKIGREHFEVSHNIDWVILDLEVEKGALQDGAKILTAFLQMSGLNAEVSVKANLPIDIGFGQRRSGRGGIRASDLKLLGERVERVILSYANVLPTD